MKGIQIGIVKSNLVNVSQEATNDDDYVKNGSNIDDNHLYSKNKLKERSF